MAILIDEMKIQEDFVLEKNLKELIRFINLGNEELSFATSKDTSQIVTYFLVFLICNIFNPVSFSLANFAYLGS